MFKLIIAAAAFAATIGTSSSVAAQSYTVCIDGGRIIEAVAVARDNGMSAADAYLIMEEFGLEPSAAVNVLELVYITGKSATPEALEELFLINCLGQSA
jgi:hypothetical protein